MDSSVIAFAVLKIKRDAKYELPADFRGWTNCDECNIFAECVEKIIMKKSGFSTYYLDEDDFSFENGKIRACNYDEIHRKYVIYFGIDYLQKIFYDKEFTTEFLKRILSLYIKEQQDAITKLQKGIDNAQEFLQGLSRSRVKK